MLRFVVSGALLFLLATRIDLHSFGEILSQTRLELLCLSIAVMIVERFYAAYRWHVLLKCGKVDPYFPDLVKLVFASGFFGLFLPGGSIEAMRVIGQSRKSNDLAFAFSSVLVDRLLGVFALAATTLAGILIARAQLDPVLAIWAIAVLAAATGTYMASLSSPLRRLARRLLSFSVLRNARDKFEKLLFCLDRMRDDPIALPWGLILAFGFQFGRVVSVYLAALALGVDLSFIYFLAFVPLIIFIQLIPISIGGFGTREAAFAYLFGTAGISTELAISLSLLVYFATLMSSLPGAWIGHSAFSKPRPEQQPLP